MKQPATIWELSDTDFYLLCRRVEAVNTLRTRQATIDMIERLTKDGLTTQQICKKLSIARSTVNRYKQMIHDR